MYAHARIVDPRDGQVYERGTTVPDDLPGIEELQEHGSVSEEEFADPDPYGINAAGINDTANAELQRLTEARARLDSGEITAEEFAEELRSPTEPVSSSDGMSAGEAQR